MFLASTPFAESATWVSMRVRVHVWGGSYCPGLWVFSLEDLLLPVQSQVIRAISRDREGTRECYTKSFFCRILPQFEEGQSFSQSPWNSPPVGTWKDACHLYSAPVRRPFLPTHVQIGQETLITTSFVGCRSTMEWQACSRKSPVPSQWWILVEAGRFKGFLLYCQKCCRPVVLCLCAQMHRLTPKRLCLESRMCFIHGNSCQVQCERLFFPFSGCKIHCASPALPRPASLHLMLSAGRASQMSIIYYVFCLISLADNSVV